MRKLLLSLAVIALVSGCTTTTTTATTTEQVGVTFNSRPNPAEVYVDGKFIGTTPVGHKLAPGVHVIEIGGDRYQNWRRELTLTPGNPTQVTALLEPKQ
jgi:hypothetical protein